jgi:Mn-dependent DtxR family transcriptional regulator
VAAQIRARHRTLAALLEQLGLDRETIEQEVEDIEHHLKPRTLAALEALVAHWRAEPEHLEAFRRFRGSGPR